MRPAQKSALLTSVLALSGCFQEQAPRPPAPLVVTAESVARRTMTAHTPANPAPEVPGTEFRREAVYRIADAGEVDAAALIGQSLYDPDSRVRMAAVEALTGIGDESSADWMAIALGDADPRIRRTAVEALGEIGGYTAKFLLQQSIQDADEGVREAAQQILAEPGFAESGIR